MAAGGWLPLDGTGRVKVLEHWVGACSVISSVGTMCSMRTDGLGDTILIKLCNK